MKYFAIIVFFISSVNAVSADAGKINDGEIHQVTPKSGDALISFLNRYEMTEANGLKALFLDLNNLTNKSQLFLHRKYKLPIYLYNYNGKSIRTTLGIDDWETAVRIKKYNESLLERGVRWTHFTKSNILWVPFTELESKKNTTTEVNDIVKASTPKKEATISTKPKKINVTAITDHLYGKKYEDVKILDQSLKNRVFYIVSGHGGPDPGAVCKDCSSRLCEDEYAYDVSLRLARNLRQHGAKVELVVQDKNDGIRDKSILKCDSDERLADNSRIPANQMKRLVQRTDYINKKYKEYKRQGYNDQVVVSLHIDSNSKSTKQDVFFCYYKGSDSSKKLAVQIRDKFQEMYDKHQKNRGYKGYLHSRNIYVLRKTSPPAVLIELANIQNKHNHKRILLKENRQALAKWIYEGLVNPTKQQSSDLVASR